MPTLPNTAQVVVITGASSGAGRATAVRFAQQGATLLLAARRQKALEEVAALCTEWGATAAVMPCDVTDAAAVQALADHAVALFGRIDVWVNNAGVLAAGTFEETPMAIHDQVIRTNLMGYLHGAHAVVPVFKRQGYGILINNISVGGWFPAPYAVGYSASKWGLRGFSAALRGELHRFPDIHVCDVFPGFLDTPGMQHAANYTGRYLKPAPPVYDPQRVAAAITALAQKPKSSTSVGLAAPVLKAAYALFPAPSRKFTALAIEGYLKAAAPLPTTPGNLFEPEEFGSGIHGGWNSPADARKRQKTSLLILAALAAGWLLARR